MAEVGALEIFADSLLQLLGSPLGTLDRVTEELVCELCTITVDQYDNEGVLVLFEQVSRVENK